MYYAFWPKLIRDKLINNNYKDNFYHVFRKTSSDIEYKEFLFKKFNEELNEISSSQGKDISEFADLYQILIDYATLCWYGLKDIQAKAEQKKEKKWWFQNWDILIEWMWEWVIYNHKEFEKTGIQTFGFQKNGVEYKIRQGAYMIIFTHWSKILIVKNKAGYFLPGWEKEWNEDSIDCLKREALEELWHEVKVKDHLWFARQYSVPPSFLPQNTIHFIKDYDFYVADLWVKNSSLIEEGAEVIEMEADEAMDILYDDFQKRGVYKAMCRQQLSGSRK